MSSDKSNNNVLTAIRNLSVQQDKLAHDTYSRDLSIQEGLEKNITSISGQIDKITTDIAKNTREISKLEHPNSNSSRIAILSPEEFKSSIDIIEWMINKKLLLPDNFDIIMYTNQTTALTEMEHLITKGYKCIIGTQGSDEVLTLVPLLKDFKEILYFNTYSTSTFHNNPDVILPPNLIRTAVLDDELINIIFERFFSEKKFYDLLSIGNHHELAAPLEMTIFPSKLCYIYQSSSYTDNYLNEIIKINNKRDIPYEIEVFELTGKKEFPQELITLMLNNRISKPDYILSKKKTLFIVNSSTTQDLLNLFNNDLYGDNYFLFGDPYFDRSLNVNTNFKYSFIGIGNFSELGYKFSKFIDPKQNVSPMGLALIDTIGYISPIYFNNLDLSTYQLTELLKTVELINYSDEYSRDYWFKKNTLIFHTINDVDDNNKFDFSYILFESSFNPTTRGATVAKSIFEIKAGAKFAFVPDYLKVSVGDTVNFVLGKGINVETIKGMIPIGATKFKSKKDFSVILNKEGLYGIKCSKNYVRGMVALIQVDRATNLEAASLVKHRSIKPRERFSTLFSKVT